ncbi:MAG TPA: amidase family protein, partial [Methylomirabilota bacterium]|nr:amidase family protein [Methylomirabilota bacterium]
GPYLPERRQDFDAGLVAIVEEARRWGPTRYVQAWFDRLAWGEHARRLFEAYDLLLTPTVACPPFTVGLDNPMDIDGVRLERYEWIPFTYPFNMTGHPAASVPCGFTADRLPIGLQIVGRRFADATVLRASAAFERIQPWSPIKPPEVSQS